MSVPKTVKQLKEARLPHAKLIHLSQPSIIKLLNQGATYGEIKNWLWNFLDPSVDCPNCGRTFLEWGIRHGEAKCVDCGYPCLVYHRNLWDKVDFIKQPLFVHPDNLRDPQDEQ